MIVTCGEALIDMVPITVPKQVAGFQPLVGGALFPIPCVPWASRNTHRDGGRYF